MVLSHILVMLIWCGSQWKFELRLAKLAILNGYFTHDFCTRSLEAIASFVLLFYTYRLE